ncbi:MAG: aminopeptidase P family protein [Thermoleophilia bacterium]|nr:aminopeptidase P family protein [Thermoleophilia bacterium]
MSGRADRRARVVEELVRRDVAALIVTHLPSIRYLTGFVGSNGTLVVSPASTTLLTDARYGVAAREAVDAGTRVVITALDATPRLVEVVSEATPDGAVVAVEADHITLARADGLRTRLADAGARTLSAQTGIVEDVRAVKDEGEARLLRESAAIADAALARVLERGLVGRTERDVAWDIVTALRHEGAEAPSFDCIVAAGANGARPHAVPSGDVIPDDTLVVIDMGAIHGGYCSDMTRTVPVGDPPAALREIYSVCLRAQRAAVAAVRPGVACGELDAVARDIITEAGFGDQFGHGLGHGVGIEIHEAPRLGRNVRGEVRAGMAVTIEPGIYLEGIGGVRIEDLVLVTDDGAEVISRTPIAELDT